MQAKRQVGRRLARRPIRPAGWLGVLRSLPGISPAALT